MSESLPGCVGYYGMPVGENDCRTCDVAGLCSKVIAKSRLKPLFSKIEELKVIIQEANK